MISPIEKCLLEAIADVWVANKPRRDNMAVSLPNWPVQNFIGAPLCLNDLYVMVQRKFGAVSFDEFEEAFAPFLRWQLNVIAPHVRGSYSLRLMRVSPKHHAIIRFGEQPDNGIMCVLEEDDRPTLQTELERRLDMVDAEEEVQALLEELAVSQISTEIELAWLRICDDGGDLSAFNVAHEFSSTLEANHLTPAQLDVLPIFIQATITSWSHRIGVLSLQSVIGNAIAFDIITTPSGCAYLIEWPEEGDLRVIDEVDPTNPESSYQALKHDLLDYFQDGCLQCDMVVFGSRLVGDKPYPVHRDKYWRELLGFPFAFQIHR